MPGPMTVEFPAIDDRGPAVIHRRSALPSFPIYRLPRSPSRA
ncbi:hypothetical protein VT85_18725 [Planctomyces sp. SH-PL62]|nr:hypothetical protein VT85_18725 [Planctomyces sp. SH-PL62]